LFDTLRDLINAFRTKESIRGFATGIWLVVIILTTVSFLGAIEINMPPQSSWVSPSLQHVLGFPSWQQPEYKLFITAIGPHAGSIKVIVEQVNGWCYNGTFYIGDTITMGAYKVVFKEINMDRKSPILLEYYELVDIKLLLTICLSILTLYIFYSLVPRKKR
jgi:hypothetical protein